MPSPSRLATWPLVAALVACVVSGCDSSATPRPDLEIDLAQYLARVKRWAPMEQRASVARKKLFQTYFVDVDAVMTITTGILPDVDRHIKTISAFTPRTPELTRIHERYLAAWRQLREGLHDIEDGMRQDDAMRLAEGRRRLDAWTEGMLWVAAQLRDLADTYGISPTKSAAGPAPDVLPPDPTATPPGYAARPAPSNVE